MEVFPRQRPLINALLEDGRIKPARTGSFVYILSSRKTATPKILDQLSRYCDTILLGHDGDNWIPYRLLEDIDALAVNILRTDAHVNLSQQARFSTVFQPTLAFSSTEAFFRLVEQVANFAPWRHPNLPRDIIEISKGYRFAERCT